MHSPCTLLAFTSHTQCPLLSNATPQNEPLIILLVIITFLPMSLVNSTYCSDSERMLQQNSSLDHRHHHRRKHSGELDVFEAARYFSGYSDVVSNPSSDDGVPHRSGHSSKPVQEERQQNSRGGRTSLDTPTIRAHITSSGAIAGTERSRASKEKKQRQPSSPGGRITSFLTSLFNQSSSSPSNGTSKKKKSAAAQSLKDEDEISPGGWRRRRRSSISHFWTSSAVADSKSLSGNNRAISSCSDVKSESRTLQPCTSNTSQRDSRSLADHRQAVISISHGNRGGTGFGWPVEKWKVSCVRKEARTLSSVDCDEDGGGDESDSSSDLFELPVYETTRVESMRTTISTGTAVVKEHI